MFIVKLSRNMRSWRKMGFGLKEQKLLWHKVREIGGANQMIPKEAVQKFLKDVKEEYDTKLRI